MYLTYLNILRPSIGLLTIFGLLIGFLVSEPSKLSQHLTFAVAAAFLISSSGNVINDYFDFEIDRINRANRPLPSGGIARKNALRYFGLLNILGLLLASQVNPHFLALAGVNSGISLGYAWRLKKTALIGNIAVSWLASSTFLAGGLVEASFREVLRSPLVFLAAIAFLVTMGREIYKDIEDIRGDKTCGATTMPIAIGVSYSLKIAKIIILFGASLALIPYLDKTFNEIYLAAVLPSILILLYAVKTNQPERAQKTLKAGMFLGAMGFLIGSLLGM
jgi:geranylgeranylglycerol-phosphate geranylgeranyltransferase